MTVSSRQLDFSPIYNKETIIFSRHRDHHLLLNAHDRFLSVLEMLPRTDAGDHGELDIAQRINCTYMHIFWHHTSHVINNWKQRQRKGQQEVLGG